MVALRGKNEKEMVNNRMKGIGGGRVEEQGKED